MRLIAIGVALTATMFACAPAAAWSWPWDSPKSPSYSQCVYHMAEFPIWQRGSEVIDRFDESLPGPTSVDIYRDSAQQLAAQATAYAAEAPARIRAQTEPLATTIAMVQNAVEPMLETLAQPGAAFSDYCLKVDPNGRPDQIDVHVLLTGPPPNPPLDPVVCHDTLWGYWKQQALSMPLAEAGKLNLQITSYCEAQRAG